MNPTNWPSELSDGCDDGAVPATTGFVAGSLLTNVITVRSGSS